MTVTAVEATPGGGGWSRHARAARWRFLVADWLYISHFG